METIKLPEPKEVGRLVFREGRLYFEGDADESAKQFLLSLQRVIDEYIRQRLKEATD